MQVRVKQTQQRCCNAAEQQQQHVTNEAYVGPAVPRTPNVLYAPHNPGQPSVQRTPNVLYAPYNPNKRNVPLTPNILYSGAGIVYAVATDGTCVDQNNHYDLGPGGNRGRGADRNNHYDLGPGGNRGRGGDRNNHYDLGNRGRGADRNNHYDLGPGGKGATLRRDGGGGGAAAASIVYAIPFESGDGSVSTLRGASTDIVYATPLDSIGDAGSALKRHSVERQPQRATAPPDNRPSVQPHDQQQQQRPGGSLRTAVNDVYGSDA